MNSRIRAFIVVGSLAVLVGGCGWSKVQTMKEVQPSGTTFDKALHGGYVKLAESEAAEEDWRDAVTFAERAITAASGKPVYAEAIEARDLPKDKMKELLRARNRLVSALIRNGRKKAPGDAAHAQVMFDCWMQEQEENHQPKDIKRCRAGFEEAMAKVDAALKRKPKPKAKRKPAPKPAPKIAARPAPKPKPATASFIVYFDFDKAKITSDGRAVIDKALGWAKDKGASRVTVTGHTDRAGTNAYNMKLSQKRAKAVADALIRSGIGAGAVKTRAFGEENPAVATADGKREARNRRAEINLVEQAE